MVVDSDMSGDEGAPSKKEQPAGPAKKKTASETYTKVCGSLFAAVIINAYLRVLAFTIGAHPQTTRFLHWQRGDDYTADVDVRF
jgi:hypothetical protein